MTPTLQGDCLIKEITKKWLEEKYACTSGIDWFTKQSKTDSIEVLNELIKQNRLEWANWLIVRVMDRPQYLAYAIFAAEQVIDIFERKYPDDKRARLAIEASRAVLENDTAENRFKAKVYCYSLNCGFAAEWAALAASTASVFAAEWAASTASLAAASSWSVWTTWASAWSKWAYSRENAWASAKSAVQYSAMNVKIILEKLDQYIRHAENCILSRWEEGESTPGGYRKKYDGRWYQYSPVDKTPKCNCGLDEILNGTNQEAT